MDRFATLDTGWLGIETIVFVGVSSPATDTTALSYPFPYVTGSGAWEKT